jgi:hypothetical protein
MAQTAKKLGEIKPAVHGRADSALTLDLAAKSLIDGLIVPHLVEEFLRLYGPAAVSKSNGKISASHPNSELDSTP